MDTEKIVDININNKETTTTTPLTERSNRIDLYKLVENYNKRTSTKMKEEFLKSQIKIIPYVEYGTKMFLADQIVNTSCIKNDNVHIDSCKKYVLYIYTLIKYWTNIDIKETDLLNQYDTLDKYGLVEEILGLIPEKEVVTFKSILDMKQNDLMTNKYENHAFIKEELEKLYPKFDAVISPLLDRLIDKIESLDENKIEKMINRLSGLVKKI